MRFILFLSIPFLLLACGNDTDSDETSSASSASHKSEKASDCKYGKPVAIFSEALDSVKTQSFELIGQKGIETVTFTDDNILELYQSGCNEIRQEYRFFLKGNYKDKPNTFWFEKAVERLSYVGNIDDKYAVIGLWVGALDHMSKEMTIGQFSEAEPGTFMMVDKIVEQESAMVIIVLERRA